MNPPASAAYQPNEVQPLVAPLPFLRSKIACHDSKTLVPQGKRRPERLRNSLLSCPATEPRSSSASPSSRAALTPPVSRVFALLPLAPPLFPPNPALKYSVVIPNTWQEPGVPQGKRRTERLRNLSSLSCLALNAHMGVFHRQPVAAWGGEGIAEFPSSAGPVTTECQPLHAAWRVDLPHRPGNHRRLFLIVSIRCPSR